MNHRESFSVVISSKNGHKITHGFQAHAQIKGALVSLLTHVQQHLSWLRSTGTNLVLSARDPLVSVEGEVETSSSTGFPSGVV